MKCIAFSVAGGVVLAICAAPLALANIARLSILKEWMDLRPARSAVGLSRALPAGWRAVFLGDARGEAAVQSGTLTIVKRNDADYALVSTDIQVRAGEPIGCLCEVRGVSSFMRSDDPKEGLGYAVIPESPGWRRASIHFRARRSGRAVFAIGTPYRGVLRIRSAQCTESFTSPRTLIRSPAFTIEPPRDAVAWWRHTTAAADTSKIVKAMDTLARRGDDSIEMTAAKLLLRRTTARNCDAAAILSGTSQRFAEIGGEAAAESLCDLAIASFPSCPDGFREKARLYENADQPSVAASFYEASAARTTTREKGYDLFKAGMARLERTGETEAAIRDLSIARRYRGWEGSAWYEGAAGAYLVSALARAGRCTEASSVMMSLKNTSIHRNAALAELRRSCRRTERIP